MEDPSIFCESGVLIIFFTASWPGSNQLVMAMPHIVKAATISGEKKTKKMYPVSSSGARSPNPMLVPVSTARYTPSVKV